MAAPKKPDPFEQYEALPSSYHKDPRWGEVVALRRKGSHAEANGLVMAIRSSYGFEG